MTRLISLLAVAGVAATSARGSISENEIRAHVRLLASDLLEGRGPATRGDALAESYVAAQFESMGLVPAGADGGYFQPFEMVGIRAAPGTLRFASGGKSEAFRLGEEAIVVSGAAVTHTQVEAEVVFVGYGIVAPEFQWNDFKDVDLKGKMLLVMNNDPESDPKLFAGKTRLWYGRWDYKFEQAARTGAVGAIIIHTTPSAGYPWGVIQSSWSGEQFSLPQEGASRALPVKAWLTDAAALRLVAMGGKDLNVLRAAAERRDFKPVPLGVRVSTEFTSTVEHARTANVLGLLPGSDAKLKNQWVLFTAHHDHLGKRQNGKPGEDVIYNGAVDNASGVAQLLAIARAFTKLPTRPRRSILFAAVGAEEQGLLGSEYLAHHLPVPANDVAADINIDGANIFGRTSDVAVIGLGKTNLDATLARLAALQHRVLKSDLRPDRGFFYRSDQFSFARVGIPAAYFSSGLEYRGRPTGWGYAHQEAYVEQHYHQPSDELTSAWDLSGAVEDCELSFQLGRAVANAQAMPRWTPGDEFEARRRE